MPYQCQRPTHPELPPPPEKEGLESRVAVVGWLLLCLNVFFFGYLAVVDPRRYDALTWEDYWVENLTAALFVLTGLLLFTTALAERSRFRRGVYILGGIAMVFIAGEEISWGQRIIGLATPDFLIDLNAQDELNVHNINTLVPWFNFRYGTLLLCTVTCAAFFCRKGSVFGIPLPSILLTLGFLVPVSYYTVPDRALGFGFVLNLDYTFSKGRLLLLLFIIYAMFSRQTKEFAAGVSTVTLVVAIKYVNQNVNFSAERLSEVVEYLFGIVCLFYALELLLAQESARRNLAALLNGIKLPGGRIPLPGSIFNITWPLPPKGESITSKADGRNFAKVPPVRAVLRQPWLTVCALVILCSIGLALLQYFSVRTEAAGLERRYRSIMAGTAGAPIVSSDFDVYHIGNELTYFKERCDPAVDAADPFFLHLIPADVNDLPKHRRHHGYDNLGFEWRGATFNRKCITTVPLPDYPVTTIRTGQYVPGEGRVWEAEFPFPE